MGCTAQKKFRQNWETIVRCQMQWTNPWLESNWAFAESKRLLPRQMIPAQHYLTIITSPLPVHVPEYRLVCLFWPGFSPEYHRKDKGGYHSTSNMTAMGQHTPAHAGLAIGDTFQDAIGFRQCREELCTLLRSLPEVCSTASLTSLGSHTIVLVLTWLLCMKTRQEHSRNLY